MRINKWLRRKEVTERLLLLQRKPDKETVSSPSQAIKVEDFVEAPLPSVIKRNLADKENKWV